MKNTPFADPQSYAIIIGWKCPGEYEVIRRIMLRAVQASLVAVALVSCSADKPAETTAEVLTTVAPRPEIYAEFTLTADLSYYTDNQLEMIGLLIEVSQIMDDLFWKQAYGDDYEAWLARLGAQYEVTGRLKLARESYEAALRLDQQQPLAKNNLAWLLADAENPSAEELDRALELAQDAKEKLPRNSNVADTLGWVMFKKDLPAAAVSLFQEAIRGYGDKAELRALARYHLAQTYERTGQRELAIAELERALKEAPSFPERGGAEALLARLSSS